MTQATSTGGRAIGVLGGTFDPIHYGHLAIGEAAREALDLDAVLFVPAALPPHKLDRHISPAIDRLAMVEAAIADNPAFASSTIEIERDGPSYSSDTLASLAADERARGREPDLWFILSSEAVRAVPNWHEPARLLEAARLAVMPRAGAPTLDPGWFEQQFPGQGDRFRLIDGPAIRLSGSDIRRRVAAGQSIRYLVSPAVAAYISDHGLYRTDTGG